jgi:hypothetical protein
VVRDYEKKRLLMSVLKRKRGLSGMEFYKLAKTLRRDVVFELLAHFTDDAIKEVCPTGDGTSVKTEELYPLFLVDDIRTNMLKILNGLMGTITRANSIYPTNKEEFYARRALQCQAISWAEDLQTEIEYIVDIFPRKLGNMFKFIDQTDHLTKLLRDWKASGNKILKMILESGTKNAGTESDKTTNFTNANNNGNSNNNAASNAAGGVAPDLIDAQTADLPRAQPSKETQLLMPDGIKSTS